VKARTTCQPKKVTTICISSYMYIMNWHWQCLQWNSDVNLRHVVFLCLPLFCLTPFLKQNVVEVFRFFGNNCPLRQLAMPYVLYFFCYTTAASTVSPHKNVDNASSAACVPHNSSQYVLQFTALSRPIAVFMSAAANCYIRVSQCVLTAEATPLPYWILPSEIAPGTLGRPYIKPTYALGRPKDDRQFFKPSQC